MFRNTATKEGDIFYVEDKEIGLRELAMNVAIPTDPGQRTVKGKAENDVKFITKMVNTKPKSVITAN